MTIRRFSEWGKLIVRPNDVQLCDSDAQVAKIATHYRLRGAPIPHIHVTAGSLATSLGESLPLSGANVRELPIDLLNISYRTSAGLQRNAIAANSVLMRRRLWTDQIVAITNSGYWRSWEIAPRAHPNDSVFDVVEVNANMTWRHRLVARYRLPHGRHMPHPSIKVRQCGSETWKFDRPIGLYIDDEFYGLITDVEITTEADALNLVI